MWAIQRFELAFRATEGWSGARTLAFSLLGLGAFLRACPGHREAAALRAEFQERLMEGWRACSAPDWNWVEQYLTYDNARVAQAMIEAAPDHPALGRAGLEALAWLMDEQSHRGVFRPIGSNGFYERGAERAIYRSAAARGPRLGLGVPRGVARDRRRTIGSTRRGERRSGSPGATISARPSTMSRPAGAATGSTTTA